MEMRVSSSVIVVLLFALLCWTCCSGKMKLCSNSLTGFKNGTVIPATVGEPVTISFCVQWHDSDGRISDYIKIIHANHQTQPLDYYSHSAVTAKLTVNVDVDKNSARISITIIKVEHADLSHVFVVQLYTEYKKQLSVATIYTFQLKLADPVTDVSSPRSTTTPIGPKCCPGKTPACPENWYQVDNDTCLMVIDAVRGFQPWIDCKKHGAEALKYSEQDKFNCCLQNIVEDSQGNYTEIARLHSGYVGIQINVPKTQYPFLKLACFKTIQNFNPVTSLSSPSQSIAWVAVAVGTTVGVIVGVIVTVAVFLVRVFFQKRAQRSEAVSQDVVPNTEYGEVAGTQYESATQGTPAMDDLEIVQHIQIEDVQYERPAACIHSRGLISNVLKSDVEYANTVCSENNNGIDAC